MFSALFALLARLLERRGVLKPITNPLQDAVDQDAFYAKSAEDVRQGLSNLIEGSRRYFGRYRQFDPKQIGFTHLRSGAFGDVYASPCERFIIRVSIDNDDSGYGRFVRLAQRRQDNPYFPRIFAHIKKGNRNVVLMERLQPLPPALSRAVYDLRDQVEARSTPEIKADAHYQQLVGDIRGLLRHPFVGSDIATRNAMMRPTPEGDQLVITDPVV